MSTALWLPGVLRLAGLIVVEHDGWESRSHGDFSAIRAVVWHHDGSPDGTSPGVPAFMIRNWANASANCWVDLAGRWHLIGAGVSYHAGKVLPGKPGNWDSLGVETDHTTGETWSGVVLLDSLRRGTAAILRHLGQGPQGLEFHKTICSPVGRKSDPDGLELGTERGAVAALLTPQEDDMTADESKMLREVHAALTKGVPGMGVPSIQTAVTEIAYNVSGVDLPGKPSRIKQLLGKAGIKV